MTEEIKSRIETDIESLNQGIFTGDEGSGARSTPHKDFVASIVVGLVGLLAMFISLRLDAPDSFYTAPGLLPFVTGASLLLMAIGHFIKTKRQYGMNKMLKSKGILIIKEYLADIEASRTLMLMIFIGLYILVLGQMDMDLRFKTTFYTFRFSGFELISIPVIFVILRFFWRSTIFNCLFVSAGIIIFLAVVFRDGFQILLPGSG